ncbi:MAG: hypothetical protein ACOC23_08805 [Thermodesulfobacteriota bacterium]
MSENVKIWNQLRTPPGWALRKKTDGRLKGKSDISPLWRMQALTEVFGPCGFGWRYEIVRIWSEPGHTDVIFAHAHINLFVKIGEEWSAPIPGIGGNQLVKQENRGPYANDEGYKMAITDALSVAMKALGVAADIYAGAADSMKYTAPPRQAPQQPETPAIRQPAQTPKPAGVADPNAGRKDLNKRKISEAQKRYLEAQISERGLDRDRVKAWCEKAFNVASFLGLNQDEFSTLKSKLPEWEARVKEEATA